MSATSEEGVWTLPNGLRLRILPAEVTMIQPDGGKRKLAFGRDEARALAMAISAGVNPMATREP